MIIIITKKYDFIIVVVDNINKSNFWLDVVCYYLLTISYYLCL